MAAGACLVDNARCFARARAPLRAMERYSTQRHSSSVACYLLPSEVMLATTPSTTRCTTWVHDTPATCNTTPGSQWRHLRFCGRGAKYI